jgi:hypothetical protein
MPHFAIADTSSAASSLLNGLNAAANQQAQLLRQQQLDQQAQAQRQFENQLQMHLQGAIPAEIESGAPTVSGQPPPMRTRTPNPAAQGAGETVQDPQSGRSYYLPTASEKEQAGLNDTNSFIPTGQLGTMLEGAGVKRGSRIKASDSHSIMQSLNEAQMDEPYDIDTSGKFQDANGDPAAVMIGRKTGKVKMLDLSGGSRGAAADGPFDLSDDPGQPGAQSGAAPAQRGTAFSFAPPEKADKPDVSQIVPGMQGPNGGPLIYDKTAQSMKEIPPVPGSKGVLTAAQTEADKDRHLRQSELQDARDNRKTEADQRRADEQAKVEEQFARQHEAAGVKKESMQSMAQGYWDSAQTAPEGTYFPPRLINGIVVPGPATRMPSKGPDYEARQKELATTAKGFEKTAATHQGTQERIEKARGWGKFAAPAQTAPTTPAAQPAQKPAQPTAAQAAPAAKQVAKQLPTGHKVGDTVKLKTGKTVKIKQIYSDGTFDY